MKRILFVFALMLVAGATQAQPRIFRDSNGNPVQNHRIAPPLEKEIARMPGTVAAGNDKGDVTLVQFYDLNCPYCRAASRDIDELLRTDAKLRIVFVPYPILSVGSIEAGRVELAVAALAPPEMFLKLREKLYAGRGTINGTRAVAAVRELGLDVEKIAEIANDDDTTDKLKTHARFAGAAKLIATPSYVVRGTAIVGHPGLKPLQSAIASVRRCGQIVC